ncbi:MAG TPA: methionine gamma-lyase [Myxococcales bacterium]|jgi:methionine-gamma-lyase|nr:methionine gamma-lyase [Myxococcales bacterium]
MEDSKRKDFLEKFYLDCGFATRALHAGEHVDQPETRAHTGAIFQTSTFTFHTAQEGADTFAGERNGYIYTRLGNPTVRVLEAKLNALEGAAIKLADPEKRVATLAFSSGMAAVSSAILSACSAGDTLLVGDVVYGATEHLCSQVLPRFGIRAVEVKMADLEAVEAAMKAHPNAKAVYFETPTNPTLELASIPDVVRVVKAVNPKTRVIIDNTFATPYLQRPLELGADVVVHSTTKYICGHGTVVGGVVTTADEAMKDELYKVIKDLGSSPSPFDAWLVNLGLKTLPLRMERHCASAMAIARHLESHPKVAQVYYPGLESHPQHKLAGKQMRNYGGMVSFELKGGFEAGRKLMDAIHIWTLAVSLGSVDSLIQHPASMTHACVPKEKREKGGVTDGLVRLSVGLEDLDDLRNALDEALAKV